MKVGVFFTTSCLFFVFFLWWYIVTEPFVTADLRGGEQGFIFPIYPWIMRSTKMLILLWLDTLLPANAFRKDLAISGFFPGLHLWLSGDCPAYPLHWGGSKCSLQDPFPCSNYVRTRTISCLLLLLVNCLSAISRFLQIGRKSASVNLFLIKIYNLALKVGVAVGFRQAAGLVLPILLGTSFHWKQEQLLQSQFPYTLRTDRDLQLILKGI